MDYGTVGTGGIASLIMMAVFGIVVPVAIAVIWVVKKKEKITTVFIGAATFIVFAMILESIPKAILLGNSNAVSRYIMNHAWAFTLTAAGLAGIFEETGRWVAFKFFLKKHDNPKTAITYGIGHGGVEAVIILGITAISYISYAFIINSGTFGAVVAQVQATAPEQVSAMEALAASLVGMTFGTGILACFERLFAMVIHISCSVLVFKAVKEKGAWFYFPLAIVLHAGVDVFAALYQFGIIKSIAAVEVLVALLAAVLALLAAKVYKGMKKES